LHLQENYEKAAEDCTSATLLHPKYAKAFLRRSKLNEKLGNLTQAVDGELNEDCANEFYSQTSR